MALHTDDMSQVSSITDLVPAKEGYHVRISKAEEKESKNSGEPMVVFTFKIQDEGEVFGRTLLYFASLKPGALGNLKSVYKAVGYEPGPEGHDPESIIDMELYCNVEHEKYNGQDQVKIPSWSLKSLSDGPARRRR